MSDLATVILAAGKGTRMKSSLPKVLHPVGGKPMLQHVLDAAKKAGSARSIVVIGFGGEAVRDAIGEQQAEFVVQEEQLGTGHAVLQAKPLLEGKSRTVMVLCGDTPLLTGELLHELLKAHVDSKAKATVLTAILPNAAGYGRIIRGADGSVERIVEDKDATDEERQVREVNSGIYCFDTEALFSALSEVGNENAQGEYYLPDVLGILRRRGERVWAVAAEDSADTLGINSRSQLAAAEKILRQRKNEALMADGVTMGPYVHLRPNTKLAKSVKIGNFVEVKNSNIGEGTKLPHLSYIGDCDMGAGVNMGCGTITVNYDGKKKFRTVIGDRAFIGCNTNLVAPVTVEDDAYIGAGSTITKLVPKGNLAIARSRQKNIEEWADKRK